MAVALDYVYSGAGNTAYADAGLSTLGNFRLRYTSAYVQKTNNWNVTVYLQAKSIANSVKKIVWNGSEITSFQKGASAYADISNYSTTVRDFGYQSSLTEYLDVTVTYGTLNKTATAERTSMTINYGGIDFSIPAITMERIGATQSSITIRTNVTAPYKVDLYARYFVSNSEITQQIGTAVNPGTREFIVSDLPVGEKSITLYADCYNGQSANLARTFKTLPVYVEGITLPTTYVDIGETVRVTPTITPNNATYSPYLNIQKDNSGLYNLTYTDTSAMQPTARFADITGVRQGNAVLHLSAKDGDTDPVSAHTAVTTDASIVVCNPAVDFKLVEQNRKMLVGETYQIRYSITPKDKTGVSTDTTVVVSPPVTNSEQPVATVTSDGLITARGRGIATITVSLERRGKETISRNFVCMVVSQRPYNSDLHYPRYLTANYIDDIFNNCSWIEDYLEISNKPAAPQTNGNETLPSDVKSILNAIESHIDAIYNAIKNSAPDGYGYLVAAIQTYETSYTWQGDVANPRNCVNRWKTFLDSIYSYLSPESAPEIVTETDEHGNVTAAYLYDEDGNIQGSYYSGED